jgi:hypothetical protein
MVTQGGHMKLKTKLSLGLGFLFFIIARNLSPSWSESREMFQKHGAVPPFF